MVNIINYNIFTQKILVFQTIWNVLYEYSKSLLTRSIGLLTNLILLDILLIIISNNVYLTQFLASLANEFIMFFMLKYFTFKK